MISQLSERFARKILIDTLEDRLHRYGNRLAFTIESAVRERTLSTKFNIESYRYDAVILIFFCILLCVQIIDIYIYNNNIQVFNLMLNLSNVVFI